MREFQLELLMCFKWCTPALGLWALMGCIKQADSPQITVIGHAAFGLDVPFNPYPANSISALDLLRMVGGEAVELDVQLSADNVLFCYHDTQLDSRTNLAGCIAEKTVHELHNVHYSGYVNQPVSRLDEMNFNGLTTVFLDIRHFNPCTESYIEKTRWLEPLQSFSFAQPHVNLFCVTNWSELAWYLHENGFQVALEVYGIPQILAAANHTPFPVILCKNKDVTAEVIQTVHELGKKVVIFDVRSAAGNKEAMGKIPDMVLTDAVEHALNQ
jgi:glycerophosphoryl diester phosphodiesterase